MGYVTSELFSLSLSLPLFVSLSLSLLEAHNNILNIVRSRKKKTRGNPKQMKKKWNGNSL
jgi:hypothetical protein